MGDAEKRRMQPKISLVCCSGAGTGSVSRMLLANAKTLNCHELDKEALVAGVI